MKSKIHIIILLFVGSIFFSCEKGIDFENEYEKSYNVWLAFKASSGNSYSYKVTNSSWVGITWETIITVSNGNVIQREFKLIPSTSYEGEIAEEDLAWIEYENEIDSHQNSPAAAPITLDEVYKKAKNEWLVKRGNVTTYFEAKNEGLISMCGYVEDGCADDCFRGIRIAYIK